MVTRAINEIIKLSRVDSISLSNIAIYEEVRDTLLENNFIRYLCMMKTLIVL